jgi:excisionase family DNA binding protein
MRNREQLGHRTEGIESPPESFTAALRGLIEEAVRAAVEAALAAQAPQQQPPRDPPPLPRLLTKNEAAKELRTTARTIARWTSIGVLRVVRLPGGHPRVPREEIERLLQGRTFGTEDRAANSRRRQV